MVQLSSSLFSILIWEVIGLPAPGTGCYQTKSGDCEEHLSQGECGEGEAGALECQGRECQPEEILIDGKCLDDMEDDVDHVDIVDSRVPRAADDYTLTPTCSGKICCGPNKIWNERRRKCVRVFKPRPNSG